MWNVGDCIRQGEVHGVVTDIRGNTYYYHLENGTCGGCLAHRLEKGYRMARPRKTVDQKKSEAAAKETNGLLEAVKFCAGGFKDSGEFYASHALVQHGYISTYDGIVMYGHKIETAMSAAPHYGLLLKALKATDGGAVQITQLDKGRIQVKQKGFRTIVPCIEDLGSITRTPPDTPVGMLDSRMREAFEAMKQISNKTGEFVMEAAVFMGNGFTVACDNHMLGMYWHGLGFPELVVPAQFIEAVLKIPKPLVSFGYAHDQSVTFYFDDGSFIRSQLYAANYPNWQAVVPANLDGCAQLPDDFMTALDKLKPFLPKTQSHAYMSENVFHTHSDPQEGTAVDCPGLINSPSGIDVGRVLTLRDRITHIDYSHKDKMRFYGPNFQGVIVTFVLGEREPPQTVAQAFADHIGAHDAAVQAGTWDPPTYDHTHDDPDAAGAYVPQEPAPGADFDPVAAAGQIELDPAPADRLPNDGFSTWNG